jgi:membrane protease YdiL (CAAX protease family)
MARWRVAPRWWLAALSPLAFLAVALVGEWIAGDRLPSAAEFGRFTGMPAIGVIGVFLLILVAAFGEETGWRGYALPQLQRRFHPLIATLILAPLWALWHMPQFFVVATYRDFGVGDFVGFCIGLTCGAFVLTWLYNRSGESILIVAVWHAVYNLVGGGTDAAVGTIAAVVSTLVMVQGITLVVLEVRARRAGRPTVIGPR